VRTLNRSESARADGKLTRAAICFRGSSELANTRRAASTRVTSGHCIGVSPAAPDQRVSNMPWCLADGVVWSSQSWCSTTRAPSSSPQDHRLMNGPRSAGQCTHSAKSCCCGE